MQSFKYKIAVITDSGTGIGLELVCQLVAAGAHVAMCDVSLVNWMRLGVWLMPKNDA